MKKKTVSNRIISAVFAVLFLASSFTALSVMAYTETSELKTVKVALDDSTLFFTIDKSGKPISGYGYEYIQTIAAYAGWDVEYVQGESFTECLQMMIDGEVDLYYDITYTPERTKQMLSPDEPMGAEDYYLLCLADNKEIRPGDYSTLKGKTVGLVANTYGNDQAREWSEKNNIGLIFVEYESNSKRDAALEKGEIDLSYEINAYVNEKCSAIEKILEDEYYLVATKSKPDLIEDINSAIKKINSVNSNFILHLNDTYFSNSVISRTLSTEEYEWVKSHDRMIIGYMDNYLPFSDMDEKGSVDGLIKDITPVIFETVGIENEFTIEYKAYENNNQMYAALNSGEIDAVFPSYDNISFGVQNNILTSSCIISMSADIAYSGDYSEKTTSVIAVNKNNQLQEFYTKSVYPDAEILYYETVEDCLKAVKKGKAGSTILNGMRTAGLLSEKEFDEIKALRMTTPFEFSFAVKRGNSALFSILNRAIACTNNDLAFHYAFDYIGSDEPDTIGDFLEKNKFNILSFFILLLIIILVITVSSITSLRKSAKELEKANNAKTDFLFNMSHDIRTPMNAIIGFTNMAKKNLDDKEKLVDSLNKTQQASNLLLSLINSILEMSRIEAGKANLDEMPGDVRKTFDNFKATTLELARTKNIDLTFEIGEIADNYVYIDYNRTMRVFVNIITNAIKYTKSGGWVKARVSQVGKRYDGYGIYRFTIEDNGIGMSEEFQKHVFDEFSRENNSTTNGIQGTGLGLSLVKSFVELMNGTVECQSQQGVGTTFIVTLPLRIQENRDVNSDNFETVPEAEIIHEPEETKQTDFEGRKVLVVDDNELNREIATDILEEEKFIVECADDGTVAVDLLREKGPAYYDFILMDIQMPTMNGYDATRAIREMYPESGIPIIALSANAFAEDKAASNAAGMNDHIAKPINIPELLSVISKYL